MKTAYPIVLSTASDGITVYVPDFNIGSQGSDIAEAMEMARDAIGVVGISFEDLKKQLPVPSKLKNVSKVNADDVLTLVDIDFAEYRRANDQRAVRRNISLPSWLDCAAEKAGLNVSSIAQAALKRELHIAE